jgi:hypothetical protein
LVVSSVDVVVVSIDVIEVEVKVSDCSFVLLGSVVVDIIKVVDLFGSITFMSMFNAKPSFIESTENLHFSTRAKLAFV